MLVLISRGGHSENNTLSKSEKETAKRAATTDFLEGGVI
jgi:hypothetical protein